MEMIKQTYAIEHTCAVVVAIEQYAELGEAWKLPGVGNQAAQFTRWLIKKRALQPKNVRVFLSGADKQPFTELGILNEDIAEANSESINKFFAGVGSCWPGGELLFIYWVGHGFVARDGGRRLILGDAAPHLKTNLDMDQCVLLLRSEQAGSFRRQIAFIDTCAKFFEELQSATDLPAGGLNPGAPRRNMEQNFYFAASSGEYATKNVFGPHIFELLQGLPRDEWPPDARRLRNGIEELFDRLISQRLAQQQPAWLEYRDSYDNKHTRGVAPTLADIHNLSWRAGFPLHQLRGLTELAAKCQKLTTTTARDALYASVEVIKPLNRPTEARDDVQLDLMRLIAGMIEQGKIDSLIERIVKIESSSDEACRLAHAARRVETVRSFWPLLAAVQLPLARARSLYKAAHKLRVDNHDLGSLEEIVDLLSDLEPPEPLIEFLLRVAREWPKNPCCGALLRWLHGQKEWAETLADLDDRLEKEARKTRYLMVAIGGSRDAWRVTRAWLWSASAHVPSELECLDPDGDLASDIAALLNEAQSADGGCVHLEMLVPEELLHFSRGLLAWKNRDQVLDPEHLYPVVLRWQDRMAAPAREPKYQSGLWKRTGAIIRERLDFRRRAYWIERNYDLIAFRKRFDEGEAGELIGIQLSSEGKGRDELIGLICNGGLPYACWPRCSTVDLKVAANSFEKLLNQYHFDEIPDALREYRSPETCLLGDIVLLWDDPSRNPYDRKFSDVSQRS
jgi:hypothetical protein